MTSRPAHRAHPISGALRWAGLLAAAALAALVLLSEREPVGPGRPGRVDRLPAGVPLAPAVPHVVEAPPGRNVAVIATDDPDITVLWFFEGASK